MLIALGSDFGPGGLIKIVCQSIPGHTHRCRLWGIWLQLTLAHFWTAGGKLKNPEETPGGHGDAAEAQIIHLKHMDG